MPARNFDYVSLDILTVYPEDSGVYSCRAVSEFGETVTSAHVQCECKLNVTVITTTPSNIGLLHTIVVLQMYFYGGGV